ncbi:MAG: hypothetical protein NPIRA04_13020 [Nitrospirales bacterium]|nr:MAG: hypothetical protein NPIRA04_13020 [Nitrospirales bacterium]
MQNPPHTPPKIQNANKDYVPVMQAKRESRQYSAITAYLEEQLLNIEEREYNNPNDSVYADNYDSSMC